MRTATTLWVAGGERKDRRQGELAAALAAFGVALDQLFLELDQLPERGDRFSVSAAKRLGDRGTAGWLIRLLGRRVFGREAWRALEALIAATNRLLIVAPASLLPSILEMNELLAGFEGRGSGWREEWQRARGEILVAGRSELGLPGSSFTAA